MQKIGIGSFRKALDFILDISIKFRLNHCLGLAAELGFWFLYSLFPFLIFLVATSTFLPFEGKHEKILTTLKSFLPQTIYELVAPTVEHVLIRPSGWIALGTLMLALWASSTAVSSLMGTLNRVYEVKETRPYWKNKCIALILTGTMVFIYMLAFTVFVIGPIATHMLTSHVAGIDATARLLLKCFRLGVGFITMIAVLALTYKYAPNTGKSRSTVIPGAVLATLGWFGVSSAFSFYLSNFANYNRFYGALGAVIALMSWLYLIGLMILVGGLVNSEMHCILHKEGSRSKRAGENDAKAERFKDDLPAFGRENREDGA